MRSVVLLSRRHRLFGAAADWNLPAVELYLYDSPSEALAKISLGKTSVFLFDTRDYPRFKHVLRKFASMKTDADLVVVGQQAEVVHSQDPEIPGAIRSVPAEAGADEIGEMVVRLLQLRHLREKSGIVGRSHAIAETLSLIAHAAPLDVNILILGESGTGKELVAHAIHDNSKRRGGPLVSLNCGAMSEGVLESELFGHAKGAFTGAVAEHKGVFEQANGGTLFLDEVAEMPLGMQTRFLRALETGEFTPVGGRTSRHSDIRLVAATHRDLQEDVQRGRFRQDLYYRLRVVVINTPPLREHKEDIPVLVETFLAQENKDHGLHVKGLTRAAQQALMDHHWPGNIRELRNTIRSAAVLKQRGLIEVEDLPNEFKSGTGTSLPPYLPVPLDDADGHQMDLGVLASTLLELRRDIKDIKRMVAAGQDQQEVEPTWPGETSGRVEANGRVVETFANSAGFSPLAGSRTGDLQTAERTLIESALQVAGGNRRQAAQRLGISERTLYRKIKLYDL